MIIDYIIICACFALILVVAWAEEKVMNWFWGRVFALLGFLLKTTFGCGTVIVLLGALGAYVLVRVFSPPDPTLEQAGQAQVVHPWWPYIFWGTLLLTALALVYSLWQQLKRQDPEERPAPVAHVAEDPGQGNNEQDGDIPWFRFVGLVVLPTVTLALCVDAYITRNWGLATQENAGWEWWRYLAIDFTAGVLAFVLFMLLWFRFESWREQRQIRLQAEAETRAVEDAAATRRLDALATAAAEDEERREREEREDAERRRRLPEPLPRGPDDTDPFDGRLLTPGGVRHSDRDPPTPPPTGPRDPASGGPAHSPAPLPAAPPMAPGTRRMPPPTFGRPPARPAEERDMDSDPMNSTPHPRAGERSDPPVDHTGAPRRSESPDRPRGRPAQAGPKKRWPWYAWVGIILVLAAVGGGIWAWSSRGPSEQELLVEKAAKMQAEDTLRSIMATNPIMSKACPQGWDEDCWRKLYSQKIDLPPCVATGVNHGTTTGASWWYAMDDSCRTETIRLNGRRVQEAAARPTGEVRKYLEGTQFSQRRAFESGDTARINALLDDPALEREVILDFWMNDNVPWRVLAHPSLNQGDLTRIYGVVQANGWYEAMPWLVINPSLDPNLRGMWLTRPVADPVERERQILLGMHQPAVPAAVFSWLVDQAVDEYKEQGSLELWNTLLKAGENGDLRVDKCHLEGEKDKDRKTYPLCEEGRVWDTVGQMEQAQAENSTLPSPSVGWLELRYRCSFESFVGRHSKVAQAVEGKVIRTMSDASPPNLPPKPE